MSNTYKQLRDAVRDHVTRIASLSTMQECTVKPELHDGFGMHSEPNLARELQRIREQYEKLQERWTENENVMTDQKASSKGLNTEKGELADKHDELRTAIRPELQRMREQYEKLHEICT